MLRSPPIGALAAILQTLLNVKLEIYFVTFIYCAGKAAAQYINITWEVPDSVFPIMVVYLLEKPLNENLCHFQVNNRHGVIHNTSLWSQYGKSVFNSCTYAKTLLRWNGVWNKALMMVYYQVITVGTRLWWWYIVKSLQLEQGSDDGILSSHYSTS